VNNWPHVIALCRLQSLQDLAADELVALSNNNNKNRNPNECYICYDGVIVKRKQRFRSSFAFGDTFHLSAVDGSE